MAVNNFKLEEAIDQAYEEFMRLPENDRNSLNMMLLARKYSPRTAKHILDCLIEQPALIFAESKGGYLCADVLTATIGDIIAMSMMNRYSDQMKAEQAEQVRKDMLLSRLTS